MELSARQAAIRSASDALLALRRLDRRSTSGESAVCGVTAAQGALVHEVALDGPRGSTASSLAARLGTSASAVTQLVDGLVEAGILQREGDIEDRRRTRITLTDHGRALHAAFDSARITQTATLLQKLSDDQVQSFAAMLVEVTSAEEPG